MEYVTNPIKFLYSGHFMGKNVETRQRVDDKQTLSKDILSGKVKGEANAGGRMGMNLIVTAYGVRINYSEKAPSNMKPQFCYWPRHRCFCSRPPHNRRRLLRPLPQPAPRWGPSLGRWWWRSPRTPISSTNSESRQGRREPLVGSENELDALAALIAKELATMRAKFSITLEHLRMGALEGVILDAGGSTLYDQYSEFGFSAKTATLTRPLRSSPSLQPPVSLRPDHCCRPATISFSVN